MTTSPWPSARKPRRQFVSFELERLTRQADALDTSRHLRKLGTDENRRLIALGQQLTASTADLEETSARFNQLATAIPTDVASLSDRLSSILNGAATEADEIRSEAQHFAENLRSEAEEHAARIVTEAEVEYKSAAELRSELEAKERQLQADAIQLQEEANRNALEIQRAAENRAEEILASVHGDIAERIAVAHAKVDELAQIRANVLAQLNDFYEKFQSLESPTEDRPLPVEIVYAESDAIDAGATHNGHHVDADDESIHDAG